MYPFDLGRSFKDFVGTESGYHKVIKRALQSQFRILITISQNVKTT